MRYLFLILTLFLFSCQKPEEIKPSTFYEIHPPTVPDPSNKVWTLHGAKVFVENITKGTFTYYNHFGDFRNESNLDIFSNSFLPVDNIIKDATTWQFSNTDKKFILNGVLSYGYELNSNAIRINGLENGSSRIIEIFGGSSEYVNFKTYESYGNDGIDNFKFYTVLTFKNGNVGVVEPAIPVAYTYGGTLNNTNVPPQTLEGTTWVLTNYIDNLNNITVNDTIEFISETEYTCSGFGPETYSLTGTLGNNMKTLSLYSFSTFNGDWSGQVQANFITDGVISNATFVDIMTNQNNKKVWMRRI